MSSGLTRNDQAKVELPSIALECMRRPTQQLPSSERGWLWVRSDHTSKERPHERAWLGDCWLVSSGVAMATRQQLSPHRQQLSRLVSSVGSTFRGLGITPSAESNALGA